MRCIRRASADRANPAAYFRTILQGYERDGVLTSADLAATAAKPEPAPVEPPAERPLADWEQAWLAQKAEIRKRRQEAIDAGKKWTEEEKA